MRPLCIEAETRRHALMPISCGSSSTGQRGEGYCSTGCMAACGSAAPRDGGRGLLSRFSRSRRLLLGEECRQLGGVMRSSSLCLSHWRAWSARGARAWRPDPSFWPCHVGVRRTLFRLPLCGPVRTREVHAIGVSCHGHRHMRALRLYAWICHTQRCAAPLGRLRVCALRERRRLFSVQLGCMDRARTQALHAPGGSVGSRRQIVFDVSMAAPQSWIERRRLNAQRCRFMWARVLDTMCAMEAGSHSTSGVCLFGVVVSRGGASGCANFFGVCVDRGNSGKHKVCFYFCFWGRVPAACERN